MGTDSEAKAQWIKRVLGVTLPAASGAPGDSDAVLARAREAWVQARESVHGQIEALRANLLQSGDDDLAEIADHGLKDLTGDHEAKLSAALDGARGTDPASPAADASSLSGAIDDFEAFLAGSPEIEACDGNPFGVAVSIRQTFGTALGAMRNALAGAAGPP